MRVGDCSVALGAKQSYIAPKIVKQQTGERDTSYIALKADLVTLVGTETRTNINMKTYTIRIYTVAIWHERKRFV